ncbi:MAG: hypothetical protein KDI42_06670 [Gammaproteobacteria bacterium]|nr:hypothetical protein [Gammaproteobacteria bacterium]
MIRNIRHRQLLASLCASALLLQACVSTPRPVEQSADAVASASVTEIPPSDAVRYHVAPEWAEAPPDCIAVLPFTTDPAAPGDAEALSRVRRAVVAQLAPLGFRDIEAARVDWVIRQYPEAEPALAAIATELGCPHLLRGRVTAIEARFLAIYSRLSSGATLELIRAADGHVLWRASHTAELIDGGLPLSPLGLAGGVVSASRNLADEQTDRVVNDLARRLLATLPEVEPDLRAPEVRVAQAPISANPGPDDASGLQAWLSGLADAQQAERLFQWLQRDDLSRVDQEAGWQWLNTVSSDPVHLRGWSRFLYRNGDYEAAESRLIEVTRLTPADPQAWDLFGRVSLAMDKPGRANAYLLRATSLSDPTDPGRAQTLTALAYSYNRLGLTDKAAAAYSMALEQDPGLGFAWYNLAVMDFNAGRLEPAARKFHLAANAYLGAGQDDLARGVIRDLEQTPTPYAKQAVRLLRRVLPATPTPAVAG